MKKISIITATYNSIENINSLAVSLKNQNINLFEWIVIDSNSNDGTKQFLESFEKEHSSWMRYKSEKDFGIYDALNKGLLLCQTDYYIVIGSDDIFNQDAIKTYFNSLLKNDTVDVFLSNVEKKGEIKGGFFKGRSWLGHQQVFKGSHSIGMMIKKDLHDEFGLYSNRFPMLADGFFLKKLLKSKRISFLSLDFCAGVFGLDGISNQGNLQSLAETWQIQMITEKSKLVQTLLFFLKVIIRFPKLYKEFKNE